MPRLSSFLRLCLTAGAALSFQVTATTAQIASPVTTGEPAYRSDGMTDQPFTVEMLGAKRTVNNVLVVRLALTNRGTANLQPHQDFSGNDNATDENRISAVYAVDPNGRKKYAVLRDAQNQPLCSRIEPAIKPGERRLLYVELPAPPDTTSAVELFFPKANPILNIPIGLSQAGEPSLPTTDVGSSSGLPVPPAPAPIAPASAINEPTSNNLPNVYTNQTNLVASGSPGKGIGSIQSANSTVPFTVEVVSLRPAPGGRSLLRLAMVNNGSGNLDAAGQFAGGLTDIANTLQISGLYLVDPVSKQRFDVVRESQAAAMCSKIDPALGPGERRMLEATFPAIPASVKSVFVYFPHAAPIADVTVGR